ncbi:phosphomannomutase/phosphoglucomutase [Pelagibius litoralis]|uniref:Phosphomannomutase/phosphoglucomutase n=1 Tax=Pelagibius litoralis TaxID=374515 RepID=A0A967KDM6_9PROT|nr:phosphomannomutase/phosphoglucomutase [Pelagibius litoralis]NIA72342.1 phosphomannomutase/phosphoglucomutase [Pelagibius litoralis]
MTQKSDGKSGRENDGGIATARHVFDATLLREYDIRGIVGQTLFAADAYALGRSFGTVARRRGARAIAIGYDGRHSSPDLAAALGQGLGDCGLHVVNVGRGPTPMLYFAAHTLDVQGGVMITGSHNPPDYNGFKLLLEKASFFGPDIQALGRIAAAGDYESGEGSIEERSVFDAYVARIVQDLVEGPRPLKVAWDAGNGAMGDAMVAATARLPGEHILLNEVIDGTFPAHHPDPTVPENLVQLQDAVRSQDCDLGIAFDGDGDRIGVVDSHARILWGDQIMLYLARDILKANPGATIIADVKASEVLFDGIAAAGGKPLMCPTGHSIIKTRMKEVGSPFAGEMSAHIVFNDHFYGYDDALYAAIRVMSVINSSGESLADFRDSLPRVFNTPEIRFSCAEDRKKAVIEEVKARLKAEGAEVNDIDGVRVRENGGWWLLRASNTQDVLVARCEAGNQENLDRLIARVRSELKASGLEPPAL